MVSVVGKFVLDLQASFPHFHKKVCQPNAGIVYCQGGGNIVQSRMMNVTDLCSISTTVALHLPEKVKLLQCNGRHLQRSCSICSIAVEQVGLKIAKVLKIKWPSVFSMVFDIQKLRELFFCKKKYFRQVEMDPKFGIWILDQGGVQKIKMEI